jgi:AcrR family transcriptional regulator
MRKNQARESIIRTASRLFYKQGYSNTGVNQIIEEAEIAKSTLYQHFRSKEDLLIAYLDETGLATIMALKEVSQKGETVKEKILAIFNYLEELVIRTDFYGCHFLNIVYEMPDGEERARQQIRKQKNAVREILSEIVKPLGKPDLADEIYTLFEGALIAHKVHGATWPIISAKGIINKLI